MNNNPLRCCCCEDHTVIHPSAGYCKKFKIATPSQAFCSFPPGTLAEHRRLKELELSKALDTIKAELAKAVEVQLCKPISMLNRLVCWYIKWRLKRGKTRNHR